MTTDDVYQLVLYATAKNKQDGYVSPSDFNLIINNAQRGYLDFLLGEYQKYQPTRPFAPVEFSSNERIRDSIAPLIYSAILPVNSTTGIAAFPSDYEYIDAMWSQYNIYRIRFTQQDRLFSTYRSVIDPVAQNPIYTVQQEGFHIYPSTIGFVSMSYVRKPPPITWGYDLDGNGIPVYNPSTSQQPIWSDTDMFAIIVRALALVGVNLQIPIVMGYSQQIKEGGQ